MTILNIGKYLILGSYIITGFLGFIYPSYLSFKAIETDETNDDKFFLTYWMIYGFCQLFDPFLSYFLAFIPFFYFLKVIFLFLVSILLLVDQP